MPQNPLTGPAPREVPLPAAPLVRVIAQVRFPMIASVEKREFIAPFQEAIREDYAVMRQEAFASGVGLPGQGEAGLRYIALWRFQDLEHRWRVTLAAEFLTLETAHYTSRQDFFGRFERLLVALAEHVRPGAVDRLGVRYIDRLTGPPLGDLAAYVQPPLLGAFATPPAPLARASLSEHLFDLPEEQALLRARWGTVPPGATLDANAIEAVDHPSWVLDLDAFAQGERAFDTASTAGEARRLAERCYAFFRWSVTDRFLQHFGGDL